MEFKTKVQSPATQRREPRRKSIKISTNSGLEKRYPSNLTFYLDSPADSISLKEFEEYAVTRLTMLRAIERVNLTSNIKYSGAWRDAIHSELKKLNLNQFLAVATNGITGLSDDDRGNNFVEALCLCRQYDYISHFILRLAYCRSEELCKWFTAMELDFFRFKFAYVSHKDRETFLNLNNFNFEKVERAKIKEVQTDLCNCYYKLEKATIPGMDFYKISFKHVLDLVRTRHVYLAEGFAYVPYTEIIVVIATNFRRILSKSLAYTKKGLPRIQQDYRLSRLLGDFDKRYTGKNYGGDAKNKKEGSVSFQELPSKAAISFPLCMKELYNVVERDHHLKHFGRLQLGLFLKGIGVPIEEATKFWRSNFTKKAGMDGNRFDKQYLYNIRHMYGKEGKRADYTPYSCMKIITSAVGAGDHHGCPFRHSDAAPLRSRLVAAKISEKGITEILKLVKERHYQIACQKYFEYTHASATVEGGIQHPNQYYDESQNATLGRARKAKITVPTTRVNVYSSSQNSSVVGSSTTSDSMEIDAKEEDDPEMEWELLKAAELDQRDTNSGSGGSSLG